MQVRKAVAGSVIGGSMVAMAVAGMGTASADWNGGSGASGAPGVSVASPSHNNVKLFSGNRLSALNGNKVLSGNLNGNKILSGNRILSGNTTVIKISLFNGAFSNNVLNSGANSFNTTKTVENYNNSFNTVTVDITKNTTTTNNSSDCQGNCAPHGANGASG